jgi:CBS domain-containing protein
MIVGERRGSVYTAFVGHAIALVMAYIGIMSGSVMLPFIAYIIFRSGEHDRNSTRARTLLDTKRVDMAYNRNAIVLAPNARISTVVDHILTSYQPDFAILQGNTLLGIVTRNDVITALEQSTQDEYVTAIMQREFIRVSHTATLDDVRTKLQSQNSEVAAVYRNDEYLGLVSITDIDEAMLVIESVQNHHFLRATTPP